MNGLIPFERTIEQTTETMPLTPKQQQLLTSKRITSLRELLNFCKIVNFRPFCKIPLPGRDLISHKRFDTKEIKTRSNIAVWQKASVPR